MTHITYETAKRLKEFLGESAPEPMGVKEKCARWWGPHGFFNDYRIKGDVPAYQLHDLLSKPFCEAFVKAGAKKFGFDEDEVTDFIADWSTEMAYAYWNGGMEAVERDLIKMMEAK
jgi:hypothetical protein